MVSNFKIKGLPESDEICSSLEERDYFNAVLKCRVFLESWIAEYIFALLFPAPEEGTKENRQFINQRFSDIFYQIQWLAQGEYITKSEHANLNKLRIFSEKVLRKGDVLTVYNMKDLNDFIYMSIHYCQKYKDLVKRIVDPTAVKTR
jgi:hypothetical protein